VKPAASDPSAAATAEGASLPPIAKRNGECRVRANIADFAALDDVAVTGDVVELVSERLCPAQLDVAVARHSRVAVFMRDEAVGTRDLEC